MISLPRFALLGAAGLALGLLPGRATADQAADEQMLKTAGVAADGPGLVKFLRGFAPKDVDPTAVQVLIKQLGSEEFQERELAVKGLLALGPRATPFLRQALKSADRELAIRAEHCLKVIDGGPGATIHGAALRMLAVHKPKEAASAILEYLPFAPNDRLSDDAAATLGLVAKVDGKPAPEVVAALQDKFAVKRMAAAEALCKIGGPLDDVKKLLNDGDQQVRLRVSLALVPLKVKESIPALINVMDKVPAEQRLRAEALLFHLFHLSTDKKAAPTTPAQWAVWWSANADKDLLAKLTSIPSVLGFTLIAMAAQGAVVEIDPAGKERWRFAGLLNPRDVQRVEENVLVAEYTAKRVTLRNTKGEILWEHKVKVTYSYPITAQRLANGNTFIATRTRLFELDKNGAEVFLKSMIGNYVVAARKLPSGDMLALTTTGSMLRLDNTGKEVQRFPVGFGVNTGSTFDVTLKGNILLPQSQRNKVVEYSPLGKVEREIDVPSPDSVQALPNGNLLVCSNSLGRIMEVAAGGRIVWEHRTPTPGMMRAVKR